MLEQWLEPAARGIHDAVCGCNGPNHFSYYLGVLRRENTADAVEGDRPPNMVPGQRYAWSLPGGGVEPSREDRSIPDSEFFLNPREEYERAKAAEARVVELEAAGEALADAIRALDSYAASSQVAPLERSERAVKALDQWAALAAAGEGEGRPPRSEPDPDQPFHPCACGGDHLTIDHPSGSRLPEPSEGEDPRCATCRDVGAAYCDDCSSRVRPDARSGSRLPEPTE
jgi:hypothetical protein